MEGFSWQLSGKSQKILVVFHNWPQQLQNDSSERKYKEQMEKLVFQGSPFKLSAQLPRVSSIFMQRHTRWGWHVGCQLKIEVKYVFDS